MRAGAAALTAQLVPILEAAGASLWSDQPSPAWAGQALPDAVHALGAAARAFTLDLATPRAPSRGGSLTGIDYLGLVREQHRLHVHRRLRLVDPTGAVAALRGWQLISVLTAGRLLTMAPAD